MRTWLKSDSEQVRRGLAYFWSRDALAISRGRRTQALLIYSLGAPYPRRDAAAQGGKRNVIE